MPLRLLVVTTQDLSRPPRDATASLGLAWGLAARGIEWTVVGPGAGQPDLSPFEAVLSWWGRPRRRRYRLDPCPINHVFPTHPAPPGRTLFERELERRAALRSIPVVNPLSRRLGLTHSVCLAAWTKAGVPCARFQRFARLSEVTLPFPLVLRADGGAHALDDAYRVEDAEAGRAVLARRAREPRAPLSLAIEFRDTRYADGLYRKRRSFVVGRRLIPRQQMLSPLWQVKLKTSLVGGRAAAEDRRFRAAGEEDPELVLAAARALGPEILALDYTRLEDGSYLFWEGNPVFGMAGLDEDERSRLYREATGLTVEDCRAEHRALGLAIADLVIERVEEARARPAADRAAAGPGRERAAG